MVKQIKLKVNGILTTVCDATQLNASTALQALKTAYANNSITKPLDDTGVYIVYGNTPYNIVNNTQCGNVIYIFTQGDKIHVTINYADDWGGVTHLKTVKLNAKQTTQFNAIIQ